MSKKLVVITHQQVEQQRGRQLTSTQQKAWEDYVITKERYLQERKLLDQLFNDLGEINKKIIHQQLVCSSARKAHEEAEYKLTV